MEAALEDDSQHDRNRSEVKNFLEDCGELDILLAMYAKEKWVTRPRMSSGEAARRPGSFRDPCKDTARIILSHPGRRPGGGGPAFATVVARGRTQGLSVRLHFRVSANRLAKIWVGRETVAYMKVVTRLWMARETTASTRAVSLSSATTSLTMAQTSSI
ncbi:hypothetical protein B0H10DRAFT_2183625 [Mycena sp. CBHHK59/15]|nr:hypothetical protein B0H10DRAFT_2183625 [Mycena sp. CBHHK59/15]